MFGAHAASSGEINPPDPTAANTLSVVQYTIARTNPARRGRRKRPRPPLARLPHGIAILFDAGRRLQPDVLRVGERREPPALLVEIEDRQPAEMVRARIEVLVFVDAAVVADDPAPID